MHSKTNTTSSANRKSSPLALYPPTVIISLIMLSLNALGLLLSIFILTHNTIRLSQVNVVPEERQLLNRSSIETAAKLIEEETIKFSSE